MKVIVYDYVPSGRSDDIEPLVMGMVVEVKDFDEDYYIITDTKIHFGNIKDDYLLKSNCFPITKEPKEETLDTLKKCFSFCDMIKAVCTEMAGNHGEINIEQATQIAMEQFLKKEG